MIEVKGNSIKITAKEALNLLQDSTKDHGVYIDLDRVLDIYTTAYENYLPLITIMRTISGDTTLTCDSRSFSKIYTEILGVPSKLLLTDGKYSVDKDTRERLKNTSELSDIAKHFVEVHILAAEYNTICKSMKSYLNLPLVRVEDYEGHRVVRASPSYSILSTGRLQASDPNVQNISREFPDLITHLSDWTLLRCDSAQIEPRIMYSHFIKDKLIYSLIELYDDAYFGLLHFITLTYEEENNLRRGNMKLEKKPFTKEERQKLKLAALAAGYGSNLSKANVPYALEYVEKINKHPLRKSWEEEVTSYVRAGGQKFYTPFGMEILPTETTKYKKGTMGWISHLIRCGINNPIQGTASQLMFLSIEFAYKLLKGRKSKICYYKHDEAAFYIHNSELFLVDELKSVVGYNIIYSDGFKWLPIHAEYFLGRKEGNGFGIT